MKRGWYAVDIGADPGPAFWLDHVTADGQWLIYAPDIGDLWDWDGGETVFARLQWPLDAPPIRLDSAPAWAGEQSRRLPSVALTETYRTPSRGRKPPASLG